MELIRPGDATYDEDRTIFNAMIDRHPAAIAKCATPDDIASALDLARREGYEVAVRAATPSPGCRSSTGAWSSTCAP